ncbi:E domain-containing protein [Staphylococcus aureus]|uniref:E domain-containing protein n=1 Tax=Staphylococcus aureus TaxID=1280 RepID=UPI003AB9575C
MIQTYQQIKRKKVPGKPGIKNPDTGKVIEEPVDDVIKHGPKNRHTRNENSRNTVRDKT